jgi:hypothetical protein
LFASWWWRNLPRRRIVAADFFIAAPELDFSITELEDVLSLAVFGIVGSFVALMIDEFLSFPD